MSMLYQAIKSAAYFPVAARQCKLIEAFFRSIHWLPSVPPPADSISKILVVQPHNSLGDLLLSLPFLDQIHWLWPAAAVDVVVGDAMVPLFQEIPYVRRVIGFQPSKLHPPMRRYQELVRALRLRHEVMTDEYDLAIDPRWDSDGYAYLARLIAFLSRAHVRAAYSGCGDEKDTSLDQLMTHCAVGGDREHEVLRKLRLFERVRLSETPVPESEILQTNHTLVNLAKLHSNAADIFLNSIGFNREVPYAVLAPAASARMREWPVSHFSKVINALHEKYGLRFIAIGTAREAELCNWLAEKNCEIVRSVAGNTDVLDMCAIIAGAELFLGNDSGPGHAAGMLGRRTIVVSPFPSSSLHLDHANSTDRFHPCGPHVQVVQPEKPLAPCGISCTQSAPHCILQVSPESVLAACCTLLAQPCAGSAPLEPKKVNI